MLIRHTTHKQRVCDVSNAVHITEITAIAFPGAGWAGGLHTSTATRSKRYQLSMHTLLGHAECDLLLWMALLPGRPGWMGQSELKRHQPARVPSAHVARARAWHHRLDRLTDFSLQYKARGVTQLSAVSKKPRLPVSQKAHVCVNTFYWFTFFSRKIVIKIHGIGICITVHCAITEYINNEVYSFSWGQNNSFH